MAASMRANRPQSPIEPDASGSCAGSGATAPTQRRPLRHRPVAGHESVETTAIFDAADIRSRRYQPDDHLLAFCPSRYRRKVARQQSCAMNSDFGIIVIIPGAGLFRVATGQPRARGISGCWVGIIRGSSSNGDVRRQVLVHHVLKCVVAQCGVPFIVGKAGSELRPRRSASQARSTVTVSLRSGVLWSFRPFPWHCT